MRGHIGYYHVLAELTATAHCGMDRYTFPTGKSHLPINLVHGLGNKPIDAGLTVEIKTQITGWRTSDGRAEARTIYFVIECSKPFKSFGLELDAKPLAMGQKEVRSKDIRVHLNFKTRKGGQIILRVGLPSTSTKEAEKNLRTEILGWDFDAVRRIAWTEWNKNSSRIQIECTNPNIRQKFYSAHYHTMAATNPHTVVVPKTGSVVFMPWVDKVPASLEAWYPKKEDGNVVATVPFGDINARGNLPITFPGKLFDLPANSPQQYPGINGVAHYSQGIFARYRCHDARNIQPLWPFDYGLFYTIFAYKNLAITPKNIILNGDSKQLVTIGVNVANTGKRFGLEVVELYGGFPSTPAIPQPPKHSKGFDKVALKPGQARQVRLEDNAHRLSYWDTNIHRWEIAPGKYLIMVGFPSREVPPRSTQTEWIGGSTIL